ncbi:hypothetical protein I6H88_21330 [Elizabethkingia bruuniana]|uniref:Uncharacterized protein n=2 Tax=Elizabethkingia TaxID=308865 RepID=A0A7T7UZ72_9FLAO|nr:hypothetical protein [Elizabethkingia bruuniana]KGO10007.1 hypothetical protein KS04_11970 [Elizabethkingia miricola]MCT3940429.1 hypothetical protein [Elizabethkingia anophelis]MCT4193655.1 hypothetical protein [Elizabethkingia anophelis]MDV3662784.1 hypothetical protein [Elizabethkingia anophelis]QDZ62242.1 hypothetical protein EVD20_04525 [Elizabethkingia bruuniana]
MKTKILILHIVAGILLSFVILSCREESLPQIPYPEMPVITTERIVSKADTTQLEKELEPSEKDPPKDRDNWKTSK